METIEEEIKEKKSGWTRILLILNFIIWAIIVFMAILFNGIVKAATTNYTASDNYFMGSGGNGTLANDTWKTFTGQNTWTATNTNWYTAMNGMATAYLRINYKDMTISNANTIGQIIGIRVYLNNNYVSGTASSYTCIKESSTTGYCDFAVQFAVNGENVIIVQTYRKNEGVLTNPTFKWNAHIELDTSTVVTPNTIQNQTQQIINNENANTDRIIDRLYQDHQEQLEQMNATFIHINPDESDFEDMEDVEDELHQYTNVDLDSFNVDIDSNTASWVWTTLTNLLNTSTLVFGMVISILSVGIIKLILNR